MTIARDGDLPDRPSENTETLTLENSSLEFHRSVTDLHHQLDAVARANASAVAAVEALGSLTVIAGQILEMVQPFVSKMVTADAKTNPDGAGLPPISQLQASMASAIRQASGLHATYLREIKAFK